MKNKLSDFIEKYFLDNREEMGIISVGLGMKHRDGKETGIKSIVFTVPQKTTNRKQIPKTLNYDGVNYITDVVARNITYNEHSTFCHSTSSSIVRRHRSLNRISDGLYVEKRQCGMSVNNHTYSVREFAKTKNLGKSLKIGTLGGYAVDEQDGKLVAMSNNHVFTPGFFGADLQGDAHYNYIDESIVFPGDEQVIFNDAGNKIIANHGQMTKNNTTVIEGVEYRLGRVKRSYPHRFTGNEIDAAICSLEIDLPPNDNKRRIVNSNVSNEIKSYRPIGSSFTHEINWATTQEIDSMQLGQSGVKLFKSSRTTGAVGDPGDDQTTVCELYCDSISFSSFVSGKGYKNLIQYKGKNGIDPSTGGDSGSWVYALFNDEWKVIGMHMAGGIDTTTGEDHALACRIDRIQELLQVSPWYNPTRLPYAKRTTEEDQYCYIPNSSQAVVSGHQAAPVIMINGQKYFQAGRSNEKPTHVLDGSTSDGFPVGKLKP